MVSRKLVIEAGGFSIPFCRDGLIMFFDYYSSMFFLRTPVGVADISLKLFVLGLSGFLLSLFFAFYNEKDTKIIKRNIFFLLITLISIGTNYINGARLWFQGNRMYVPMLGVIVVFISFLTPYLENKKTRSWIIYCSVIILFLCVEINVKASYKFKNSITFWTNVINENDYLEVTSYKFHAYALMNNGRFQEAINELLPLANFLKFSNDEINYALGNAFMLNKDYENTAKIFETMVAKRQPLIPQAYANLILAMHFLNNKDKANYYFSEFVRNANLDLNSANTYLNNFNNFIDAQRKTNLQRPKTV
jgi:tetratricopeptide (TPR) repeat protein